MATFVSNASSTFLTGTPQDDIFILRNPTGIGVDGLAGNDLVTASGNLGRSTLTLGGGTDTVLVTGEVSSTNMRMGAGGDVIELSGGTAQRSQFNLGNGSDSFSLEGEFGNGSEILGASGADTVFISGELSGEGNILLGAGRDSLRVLGSADNGTVEMGGGHDVAFFGDDMSGMTVGLGNGDDRFTIRSSIIDSDVAGGGGSDTMVVLDNLRGTATREVFFRGGAGGDSMYISGFQGDVGSPDSFVLGDGGNDTITIAGSDPGTGEVYGGDAADIITLLSSNAETSVGAYGGLGADTITTVDTDQKIGFEAANESNIDGFDTFIYQRSAGSTNSALFAFSASIGGPQIKVFSSTDGPGFQANNEGIITFDPGTDGSLTARAQILTDGLSNSGDTVVFQDGLSNTYLFVNGNNRRSLSDDFLVQLQPEAGGVVSMSANAKSVRIEFS